MYGDVFIADAKAVKEGFSQLGLSKRQQQEFVFNLALSTMDMAQKYMEKLQGQIIEIDTSLEQYEGTAWEGKAGLEAREVAQNLKESKVQLEALLQDMELMQHRRILMVRWLEEEMNPGFLRRCWEWLAEMFTWA
jgi:hypothetical protein